MGGGRYTAPVRVFELAASSLEAAALPQVEVWWGLARAWAVVPLLRAAVSLCLAMSLMVLAEKVGMALVSLYAKVFRRRPARLYKCDPLGGAEGDVEMGGSAGSAAFPIVLVQIPMYNEREVYRLSIGAACNLIWPADRIIIQVLDDSTDPDVKGMVKAECEMWRGRGKSIRYETRANRKGYKAGALKVGMTYDYVSSCEFIAMFDADFQPPPDFLTRTLPFLVHNPDVALVQARWKFVNASECLMTRTQEMSMDFHFKVEQESGSTSCAFFGYNGTAGVWRIKAISDAGGWQDRTTVEDMDLAVRAGLAGWKFIYLGDVKVLSELPSTFKAYRYQQHRWSCGPANLFRKMFWNLLFAKHVSIWMKFYVVYDFFVARRIISHFVTFLFYCVVIPASVFFPEVDIPSWGVIYVPTAITLLNAVGTPTSFHLVIFWVLFENVMSLHRCRAVLVGLFETGRVNEWVVTEKLGDMLSSSKTKSLNPPSPLPLPPPPPPAASGKAFAFRFKFLDRLNTLEVMVGIYLFVCGLYDYRYANDDYFVYIFPQSAAFIIMGFGYVGTIISAAK